MKQIRPQQPVQTKYLTQDHLGSPRIITNQSGAVVSRHDYRAFGEEVYAGTANRTNAQGYGQADGIRKQYTGYERDYESGLDFAQARYYNSQHGRFTSVDPLTASANVKDPQTFNRYSYVLNSPYKFTDPLGLLPVSSAACGNSCPNSDDMAMDGSGFSSRYTIPGTEHWGQQEHQRNDGITKQEDVTSTVNLSATVTAKNGNGKAGSFDLPKGLYDALQGVAENAEKLSVAQKQNSDAALKGLEAEYETAFANKNPLTYMVVGVVVTPKFKSSNGTILTPEPPNIGVDVTVGPVKPKQASMKTTYSDSTKNLVNAANSQLAEFRKLNSSGAASNFSNSMMKKYGVNNRIHVKFKTNGGKKIKAILSKANLKSLYKQSIIRGLSASNKR